jgi:arylsulfatase A-like enzyme
VNRRTRAARRVVAALVALSAGACRPDRSEPSTVYLVAERHQRAGDPSTVEVPAALVGGERRPVLANPPAMTLETDVQPSGPEEVLLEAHIPDALRGKPVRLTATIPACPAALRDFHPHDVGAAGAIVRARVRLRGERGPGCDVVMTGRLPPETTYTSGPIAISTGARLRFAIGVENATSSRPSGGRFAVTVIDGDTATPLVETRTDTVSRRWTDHDVDLSAYAGRTVRLRFDAEGGDADAYPVWGDPTIVPRRRGPSPPNVLLISLDTLRADRLGCYGYSRPTSPAIDYRLALEGTLFERAYAQEPETVGSHMTLFTGRYPCAHGLPGPAGPRRALPGDVHTLAELLRAAGYRTGAVTEDGFMTATLGFARGFGSFTEFTRLAPGGYPAGMVTETFSDGTRWIARESDRPWFLFLHTYQVHAPYDPPQKYIDRVIREAGPLGPSDLYDGEIRYTDETLSELLTFLNASGLSEKTLLIVVGDHGEQFGEHGAWGHGNTLYNVLLHVPLIVRAPGVPASRRISDVVGLIDVLPTVLDVLGLPAYPAAQGRSLVSLWQGHTLPARTLYAEEDRWFHLVAAFAPPHKWIFSADGATAQAFDLLRDPDEAQDIAPTLAGGGDHLLDDFRSLCASTAARDVPRAPPIDRAVRDKLHALGYVQ